MLEHLYHCQDCGKRHESWFFASVCCAASNPRKTAKTDSMCECGRYVPAGFGCCGQKTRAIEVCQRDERLKQARAVRSGLADLGFKKYDGRARRKVYSELGAKPTSCGMTAMPSTDGIINREDSFDRKK